MKYFAKIIIITVLIVFIMAFYLTYFFLLYPLKYKDAILEYSEEFDVDPALIASVINCESSFKKDSVSESGAIGLMQIMPSTAEFVANIIEIEYQESSLYDPKINIRIGTKYLSYLLIKFNDCFTALCAYNAGEGIVNSWLSDENYSINSETLTTTPYKETNAFSKNVINNISHYYYRIYS